jgi:hypothetical protein
LSAFRERHFWVLQAAQFQKVSPGVVLDVSFREIVTRKQISQLQPGSLLKERGLGTHNSPASLFNLEGGVASSQGFSPFP